MSQFDDREKGFEAKYRFDQEQEFRVKSRTARLLGLWAAEKMGRSGDDAALYARTVVDGLLVMPTSDLVKKIATDLNQKTSEDDIFAKAHELEAKVRQDLSQEYHGGEGGSP